MINIVLYNDEKFDGEKILRGFTEKSFITKDLVIPLNFIAGSYKNFKFLYLIITKIIRYKNYISNKKPFSEEEILKYCFSNYKKDCYECYLFISFFNFLIFNLKNKEQLKNYICDFFATSITKENFVFHLAADKDKFELFDRYVNDDILYMDKEDGLRNLFCDINYKICNTNNSLRKDLSTLSVLIYYNNLCYENNTTVFSFEDFFKKAYEYNEQKSN